MTYALDTNIISYVLNGDAVIAGKLNAATQSNVEIIIPLMVYYESRRGLLANNATKKIQVFEKLCKQLSIIDLTAADMDTAATIYAERKRNGKLIDDGDLLIAAQCVTNNYTLITNNVKHFKDIDGLLYENWFDT